MIGWGAEEKKCPRCGLAAPDGAFFCARCGGAILERPRGPWYLRTSVLVAAFLVVGPFAIPLVWVNPRFSTARKAAITAVMAAVTVLLVWLMAFSLRQIDDYYRLATEPWR